MAILSPMQQQRKSCLALVLPLFCMVDDKLAKVNKRKNAHLYPNEIVTIGILFTLKGVHYRAFYCRPKGD